MQENPDGAGEAGVFACGEGGGVVHVIESGAGDGPLEDFSCVRWEELCLGGLTSPVGSCSG